ncbi:Transcriptional regulator, LysR family [Marinobacterium lacunae]|uniref:Transcriptional regulator, LysR family n=2 Tax=Marinobacterium lacunae TaxID=1232683 RepID=A0A081G3H0_9GAMM|nr:Transcriptional regulator, LysR family [Marinobacterium lacunae]
MQLFVRIVELGSFTAASEHLDMSRASATALMRQLESHLGVRLLQRTTRQVSTTPDGEVYYRQVQSILRDVDAVENRLSQQAQYPKGRLRVDLPASLARLVVIPALPAFYRRYPEIVLELSVADRMIDLVREGVDCVLRIGELDDSSLIARRLALLPQVTCASCDYIERQGRPESIGSLDRHFCVEFLSATTARVDPLHFMVNGRAVSKSLRSSLSVNNGTAYVAGCEAGLGIVQVPRYHVEAQLNAGRLIEVLVECAPPPIPLSVLYPQHRQMPPRLRVFIDWLVELFE